MGRRRDAVTSTSGLLGPWVTGDVDLPLTCPQTWFAEFARTVVGFPATVTVDDALLFRTIELYEVERLDFADAYLVASAEASGVRRVASFDRRIDRVASVERVEP